MKIQLTGKSFKLVEAGLNTLKIVEAKAVPSGKPQGIEFTFEDINGTQMKASYKFNGKEKVDTTSWWEEQHALTRKVRACPPSLIAVFVDSSLNLLIETTRPPSKTRHSVFLF